MTDPKFHKPTEQDKNKLNSWVKYSSLGFQMLGVIAIFTWLGWWIDTKTSSTTPWFTIILSLVGVVGGIYLAIKDLIKHDSDEGDIGERDSTDHRVGD